MKSDVGDVSQEKRKSVHVTDRFTWSLSSIARVEKADLVGLDRRLRIDVAIPRQAPLSVYLKHSDYVHVSSSSYVAITYTIHH